MIHSIKNSGYWPICNEVNDDRLSLTLHCRPSQRYFANILVFNGRQQNLPLRSNTKLNSHNHVPNPKKIEFVHRKLPINGTIIMGTYARSNDKYRVFRINEATSKCIWFQQIHILPTIWRHPWTNLNRKQTLSDQGKHITETNKTKHKYQGNTKPYPSQRIIMATPRGILHHEGRRHWPPSPKLEGFQFWDIWSELENKSKLLARYEVLQSSETTGLAILAELPCPWQYCIHCLVRAFLVAFSMTCNVTTGTRSGSQMTATFTQYAQTQVSPHGLVGVGRLGRNLATSSFIGYRRGTWHPTPMSWFWDTGTIFSNRLKRNGNNPLTGFSCFFLPLAPNGGRCFSRPWGDNRSPWWLRD